MPTKVWVNIEGGDASKHEGRTLELSINATETKPGSAKGMEVFMFGVPDGGNEDGTFVAAANRGQNFQTDPKYCTKVTLEGLKTKAKIQISIPGGDKWGFKASKKADGSGAKTRPGEPFEVWRKIFVQVGHMDGCRSVDPTSLNGKLSKLFIEIEKVGGMREIPHAGNAPDVGPPVSALRRLTGPAKYPAITVPIVFVDRIMRFGQIDWDFDLIPAMLNDDRKAKFKVKDDKLTWPFDDWLVSGKIYLFDGRGNRMAEDPINNFVSRAQASGGRGSGGRTYAHKEGLATNRILLDLKRFPNIERWMAERGAKGKVFIGLKHIQGSAGGMASPVTPMVTVANRNGWNYRRMSDMPEVLLHELGHIMGHVLRFVPRFKEDDGTSDDRDENSLWYDGHGGVGNHCHHGSTLGSDTCEPGSNPCIMFHATGAGGSDFCGQCQDILKRAPLHRLGRTNVWGSRAWTP